MSESTKAVFLSYASQDVAAALRISTALRAAGVEVWFDQDALVGGDAWDAKIRGQIGSCALFIPVISAATQERLEGYFRIEWKLAAERTHAMAAARPFLLPVVIDATRDAEAHVPTEFRAVQWTKLPGGETSALFVARVQKLLGGPAAEPATTARPLEDARGRGPAAPLLAPPSAPTQSSEVTAKNLELSADVRLPLVGGFETFVPQRSRWRRALPVIVTAVVTLLVAGLAAWRLWPRAATPPVVRFKFAVPDGQTFRGNIAVSPDGQAFVYSANEGIYLRKLGELEARVIPGTEGVLFGGHFSPDGQSIVFQSRNNQELNRIAVSGGSPVVIGRTGVTSRASWEPDDTILFSSSKGIMRLPVTGGNPVLVIAAQGMERLIAPRLLPDRDTVLFTSRPGTDFNARDEARVVAQRISTGQRTVLVEGASDARYVSTGHLIYLVENALMGVVFDARRLVVSGRPVQLVQGVNRRGPPGAAHYGVADDGGTLVYSYSTLFAPSGTWILGRSDRAGTVTALALPPGPYNTPRVSPDGTRVVVGVQDPKEDYLAIYDLDARTALRRLTFGGKNRFPVWSRDSQRIAFQSDREGDRAIFWQRVDGSEPAERLTKPEKDTAHVPASWSPKDETLLFSVVPVAADSAAIGAIRTYTRASGTVAAFSGVEAATMGPEFSPDGRWVAYASGGGTLTMEGERRIYVQPFPATGAKYEVPTPAGALLMSHPFWAPDGTALYFAPNPGQFGVVSLTTKPTVAFGNPTQLPRRFNSSAPSAPRGFDLTPDGDFIGRIAPGSDDENGNPEIHVVVNWVEELKRLVPVK
jgi:Tol biopolymer transport system component